MNQSITFTKTISCTECAKIMREYKDCYKRKHIEAMAKRKGCIGCHNLNTYTKQLYKHT